MSRGSKYTIVGCTERLEINDKRYFGHLFSTTEERAVVSDATSSHWRCRCLLLGRNGTRHGEIGTHEAGFGSGARNSGDISLGEDVHNVLQGKSSRGRYSMQLENLCMLRIYGIQQITNTSREKQGFDGEWG